MRFLLDRRSFISIGSLSAVGLIAPRAEATNRPVFGKAKSVLIVYTSGGMSQIDTWDPKPNAPAEIRGAFGSIPTRTHGVRFGEHMPRIASLSDRFAVLRSMTHDDLDHGSATYVALTGTFHQKKSSNPPVSPKDHPTYGAVLKRVRPHHGFPHTSVHINGPVLAPIIPAPGQNGGFLGRQYEPLVLGNVSEPSSLLEGLEPTPDLPAIRLHSRQSLLSQLDQLSRERESIPYRDQRQLSEQAFDLLRSSQHRHAFDLEREPERVRDRYGRYRAGQACLLGRRLIEAGVPLVTVFFNHNIRGQDDSDETDEYGWDTHNDIFESLKDRLLPRFDWSFSALLEDLETRGLLESTLVICMGEFGRAPLVALEKNFAGSSPGRKHWAACYSICLAGAGVQPGTVLGSSDRFGAYPQAEPTTPGDLVATMFSALGIDPARHFEDGVGRTFPIATGRVIEGLYR
jgi:hypothetical protein